MQLALELQLFGMMSDLTMTMANEITDEQFGVSGSGENPPSWIVGHLAICNEFGVMTLGGQPELLDPYLPMFGPGSPPTGEHPSKSELLEMFKRSRERFVAAVESATSEQLEAERDSPILKAELPRAIDMLGHLLTSHIGLHVGQLSVCRRQRGLESVLKIG